MTTRTLIVEVSSSSDSALLSEYASVCAAASAVSGPFGLLSSCSSTSFISADGDDGGDGGGGLSYVGGMSNLLKRETIREYF